MQTARFKADLGFGHALCWQCTTLTLPSALDAYKVQSWFSPKWATQNRFAHYIGSTYQRQKDTFYYLDQAKVPQKYGTNKMVSGEAAFSLSDGNNAMFNLGFSTRTIGDQEWLQAQIYGYRLTTDSDSQLVLLKHGEVVEFSAGAKVWSGDAETTMQKFTNISDLKQYKVLEGANVIVPSLMTALALTFF